MNESSSAPVPANDGSWHMPRRPAPDSRARTLLERARRAVELLHTCSPITLRRLATELAITCCQECPQDLRCDACNARGALGTLLLSLAALVDGKV